MPATAECCVCGKDASLLCGACVKEGVRLAFCSKEHQKLVWFAHKPICGPGKARIDFVPALSEIEEKLCQSELFQQGYLLPRYGNPTIGTRGAAAVERFAGLPVGSFKQNINNANSWVISIKNRLPVREVIFTFLRELLREMLQAGTGSGPLILPAHAFAFVFLRAFLSGGSQGPGQHRLPVNVIPTFLQRATILAGLIRILDGQASNTGNTVSPELVRSNLKRVLSSVLEYVELGANGNAKQILDIIASEFGNIPGLAETGIHFAAPHVKPGQPPARVIQVLVTGPGEVTPGQRAAAMAGGQDPSGYYRAQDVPCIFGMPRREDAA